VAYYELAGRRPRVHPSTFVHPLASIIGDVEIGPGCYIGAGACLRGDWLTIRVGPGSNVQDSCTIHGYPGALVVLEEGAHLGHGCIVHGAHLGRNVLVGMNAVVQDGAELGQGCVVGSGCVVPAGMHVPEGKLVVGVPGRIVGDVSPDLRAGKREGTAWYQGLARRCLEDFARVDEAACLTLEAGAPDSRAVDTAAPGEATCAGDEVAWVPWAGEGVRLPEDFFRRS
jgi:phenylacetic acid degradation protein